MWAFGRFDLRLAEDEFWALTPREFILLANRAKATVEWEDYRAAITPWVLGCRYIGKKAPDLEGWTVGKLFEEGRKELAKKTNPVKKQADLFGKAMAAFGTVSMINTKRGK